MTGSPTSPVRTRFAPSPTGLPHVGNIRTALFSWLLARHHGGQFLFRLEDTDRDRYDPASEQALYDALRRLGMNYDEGPDIGGPHAPYVQSQRLDHYRTVADELIAANKAYRCFCNRERIQAVREARQKANIHPFGYDRHCRSIEPAESRRRAEAGEASVVRFAIPADGETTFHDEVRGTIAYPNRELDDHVLLKSDGFPTYHLAHMVDDRLMEITHVIRSEEWLPSTPRHVLQHAALGWALPCYVHPGVIQGRDPASGKVAKLSKRHGAVFVGEYLEQGYLPEALLNFLALLGWAPGGDLEVMSCSELVARFSLEGINSSPSVFDHEKLNWMNGVYLRALPPSELVDRALPFLQACGSVSAEPTPAEREYAAAVLRLEQERMKTLSEAPGLTGFFFAEPPEFDPAAVNKRLQAPGAGAALSAGLRALRALPEWTPEAIEAAIRAAAESLSVKPAEVIHPTRVGATGRAVGPGLYETLHVLGRDRVLARLEFARNHLTTAGGS
jgi:glutamyl-tRNA synthetase